MNKDKNTFQKHIKNCVSLFLGFFFVIGVSFAAITISSSNTTAPLIPERTERSTITSSEFNRVVNTIKNINNDGTHIGINTSTPQTTLDIDGGLTVRDVLKQSPLDHDDCSTLGTDTQGNFECHPTYHWDYASWGTCSKVCNTGGHSRTAVCRRDDDKLMPDSFCTTAPVLTGNCNTSNCAWNTTSWGSCSKVCNTGSQGRTVTCRNPNASNTTVSNSLCLASKPSASQNCNTTACKWSSGGWRSCSKTCGTGTKTRSVTCRNPNNGNASVSTSLCGGGKPGSSTPCNTHSCCTPKTSSSCGSKDCGSGWDNGCGTGTYNCGGCSGSHNDCNNFSGHYNNGSPGRCDMGLSGGT